MSCKWGKKMNIKRSRPVVTPSLRIFAGLMAIPGLFVSTICILYWVDHPSWPVVEWAVASLALAIFFGIIVVSGRQP